MGTVRDLIRRSLMLIGAVATGETPKADEQADAFSTLNDLLDSWSTESLLIYTKIRETFPLTPSVQSYTMGVLGAFDTVRPLRIENASFLQTGSNPYEIPIDIINLDQWSNISVKTTGSSVPTRLYISGSYPLETLNFWPVPAAPCSVVLTSWKPLTAFASVNATVALPPGYAKALRYNLAVELAPEYGKQTPPEVLAYAVESKEAIKRMNIRPLYLACDDGVLARENSFNWLTGE